METLSLAAPKGYIKSKNPKRKEKKAFTHFRNVNPIYITESQYHRIAIRSPSYNIDFFAALGFPGNKYVYTLVSFFFFFHAIDRYIYIYSLLGKRIPAAAAKSFTPFLCVLLCISASLMVESGSVRKELLSLSFCYVYFGAILFAGAKQTPLFFLYILYNPATACLFFYLLLAIYCARLMDRFYLQEKNKKSVLLLLLYS
jgi:hypothetical protein